ncbi:hypothetical protein [Moorena sp. SIO3E8]|nr:hypothetical protein [Moorena sp. SIO3E8]NEO16264.1 hypothetical protein [Moorena sp. SIO3E8]NEQ02785.1 hypothetical protein [Moorena sp. SIO3F7]
MIQGKRQKAKGKRQKARGERQKQERAWRIFWSYPKQAFGFMIYFAMV